MKSSMIVNTPPRSGSDLRRRTFFISPLYRPPHPTDILKPLRYLDHPRGCVLSRLGLINAHKGDTLVCESTLEIDAEAQFTLKGGGGLGRNITVRERSKK